MRKPAFAPHFIGIPPYRHALVRARRPGIVFASKFVLCYYGESVGALRFDFGNKVNAILSLLFNMPVVSTNLCVGMPGTLG